MECVISAKIKLLPTVEQKEQLIATVHAIKQGLNFTSKVAYEQGMLSNFKALQKLVYTDLRERFGLKSQMACNVCSVVAGTYASMKSNHEDTLARYNKAKLQYSYNRDYSFVNQKEKLSAKDKKDGKEPKMTQLISIGTLDKRIKMPFLTKGFEQYFDGTWEYGTGTLVYKKGKFFLHLAMKKEFDNELDIKNVVGVDLGMRFLATAIDSKDHHLFASGKSITYKKAQFLKQRKDLQEVGTKSAKRKLKKLAGRENRFMTDINHQLSKALVKFAGEDSLIVLEDLTHINIHTKVSHHFRYHRMSWAFAQLRFFIEYKAKLNNIQVLDVDPAYTSQKCPKCGCVHQDNRDKKLHVFRCIKCGYTSNDDRIGAINLRQMGIEYHTKLMTAQAADEEQEIQLA